MSEEKEIKKEPGKISRRQFLRDAGIVVGGTAVGSAFFLSACGKEVEVTKTVTKTTTAPGTTSTVTATIPGGTSTQTVTKYICPACNQEFSSLDALKTHYDSNHEAQEALSNEINITINGEAYRLTVKPHWTLYQVLHDELGFTSVKDMCTGAGACGSCSVIVNERAVLSCITLAVECDGAVIETAEALEKVNHPLIEEYVNNDCMQCGYCTPGFIVTAKALLDENNNPTEDEIRKTLGGNICRCGTYPQHIIAVQAAAKKLG